MPPAPQYHAAPQPTPTILSNTTPDHNHDTHTQTIPLPTYLIPNGSQLHTGMSAQESMAQRRSARELETSHREEPDPALCPTDDDAKIQQPRLGEGAVHSKQSAAYVWRTGLAGGLAGCAVCPCPPFPNFSFTANAQC
jgi:hypothetical protein